VPRAVEPGTAEIDAVESASACPCASASKYRSASSAAMQPVPAAVTAWR
jgi:hypothetical protein